MITHSSTQTIENPSDENDSSANTGSPASPSQSSRAHSSRTPKTVQPKNGNRNPVDHARIEQAVREILIAVGEDPDREGLLETPARVARMYAEVFSGLHKDPSIHLKRVFTENYDEIVLVRDIEFHSMCEHHLLPFSGRAHVAYLPNGKVVGLSKLARVVDEVSRRPQVQERMTETIANMVEEALGARGVAVMIESTHSCMTMRGIRKAGASCTTSAMRGIFRENLSSRAEILGLIMNPGR
ncbi:MAG: GTP cyclohydrolase I FolE [Planctomycetes bacterium]|nr:GTP cyclohydrolase I FolE [Planctomycetota bacterium]